MWHAKQRLGVERAAGAPNPKPLRVWREQVAQAENERRGVWQHTDSAAELWARKNRADYERAMQDALSKLTSQGGAGQYHGSPGGRIHAALTAP